MNDIDALDGISVEGLVAEVTDEFMDRLDRGEQPDAEEYANRHPQIGAVLRQLLPALRVLRAPARETAANDQEPLGCLGDYRILREVGRGGMGVVYEAVQISLGRRVALKVLPFAAAMDGKQLQRFKNEAQAAAQLQHQHIVPVYGVGCERGVHYYAMQFIDGQALATVIQELRQLASLSGEGPGVRAKGLDSGDVAGELISGRWVPPRNDADWQRTTPFLPAAAPPRTTTEGPSAKSIPETESPTQPVVTLSTERSGRGSSFFRTAAHLGMQAAEALEHAHQLGVVHRDIKPANLLVDMRGNLWVTDFGLAHCQSQAGLTMTGDLIGTLRYMSPEQALAKRVVVDHRTDIYSLGATFYELVTLQTPYAGNDRQELLRQIAFEEPHAPRRLDRSVPAELETIVLKAMAKNPADRYATAQELADDLERFLEGKPIRARRVGLGKRMLLWVRRRPAVAALLAVSAVALLALAGLVLGLLFNQKLQTALNQVQRERYYKNIALANAAWQDSSLGRLEELLDDCPPEYRRHWEWRYLRRQCHAESLTLTGYQGGIMSLVYGADGKQLITSCLDGTIKVWDAVAGQELFTLPAHQPIEILRIALTSDGKRLASASSDRTVKVWDLAARRELFTLKGHLLDVAGVAFSPDGKWIATGSWDKTVRIWDAATGRERFPFALKGHEAEVFNVAFSPDGKRLASASADRTVRFWDPATGREAWPLLQGHTAPVDFVTFSPDGKWIVTGGQDRTVRLWDAVSGAPIGKLEGHTSEVFSAVFSPDGKQLASTGADRTIKIWSAAAVQRGSGNPLLLTLRGHANAGFDLAFSPDGAWLASGSQDRTVKIWQWRTSPEARTLEGHGLEVTSVAFSPDGRSAASASLDGKVKVWDVATGRAVLTSAHDGPVGGVAFSPDGNWLASASADRTVRVRPLSSGQALRPVPIYTSEVRCVAFSPDGRLLASGDMDGGVRVWVAETGEELLQRAEEHRSEVRCVAFNAEGTQLATAGADRTVKLWDLATGQTTRTLVGHHCWCYGVAFSPDRTRVAADDEPATSTGARRTKIGTRLASVSGDGGVRIWDVATGQQIIDLGWAHGGYVRGVTFSPDGSRLATAGTDGLLKLWDVSTGQEVLSLNGHECGVTSVAFSQDGEQLLTGDADGRVKIWDARPWTKK
jgi:WD40 repeat protein/serine/threonine protein kinase